MGIISGYRPCLYAVHPSMWWKHKLTVDRVYIPPPPLLFFFLFEPQYKAWLSKFQGPIRSSVDVDLQQFSVTWNHLTAPEAVPLQSSSGAKTDDNPYLECNAPLFLPVYYTVIVLCIKSYVRWPETLAIRTSAANITDWTVKTRLIFLLP